MAVEMVIKIDEHDKNVIERFVQGDGCEDFPPSIIENLIRAVYFGKRLPKGHGRLIDADRLIEEDKTCDMWTNSGYELMVTVETIENMPTIIETDKESEK